jgi:TolB-like protein
MKLCVAVVLLAGVSAQAAPTVAVMPFKDLSGGAKGNVGEAIRETVTSDLKDVSGLRVIERGRIDQVLAEQNLQASKSELDAATTVKVGKLLGATMIVTGAYQKASSAVRLTARFVKVETGEVVGTAKVDGGASEFLHLQDKVTVELLKSAGIEQKQVQRFTSRTRPKLKSMKPIELYGDAVVETDETKKKQLLVAALNEDPGFVYATRDLDALEGRLREYDKVMKAEQDKAVREMQEAMGKETNPAMICAKFSMVISGLATRNRWRAILAQARHVAQKPPPPGPFCDTGELAEFWIVQSEERLFMTDAVLRDGEKFIAKHPASTYAPMIKNTMERIIDEKRKVFEGEQEVAAAVNKMEPDARNDLCRVGVVYNENHQFREARRLLDACLSTKSIFPRSATLSILISICAQIGDYGNARRYMAMLEKEDKKSWDGFKGWMNTWPSE